MEDKMNSGGRHSVVRTKQEPLILYTSKPEHCHKQIKMWQKKALYQIFICDGCEAAGREIDLYLAWLKDCQCQVSALQTTRCRTVLTHDHPIRPPRTKGLTIIQASHWFILTFVRVPIGCWGFIVFVVSVPGNNSLISRPIMGDAPALGTDTDQGDNVQRDHTLVTNMVITPHSLWSGESDNVWWDSCGLHPPSEFYFSPRWKMWWESWVQVMKQMNRYDQW